MLASLLELSRLDWSVPDFSTLSYLQKSLEVVVPYRAIKEALDVPVDSTGIKMEGEREWRTRKDGGSKRRIWGKFTFGSMG